MDFPCGGVSVHSSLGLLLEALSFEYVFTVARHGNYEDFFRQSSALCLGLGCLQQHTGCWLDIVPDASWSKTEFC